MDWARHGVGRENKFLIYEATAVWRWNLVQCASEVIVLVEDQSRFRRFRMRDHEGPVVRINGQLGISIAQRGEQHQSVNRELRSFMFKHGLRHRRTLTGTLDPAFSTFDDHGACFNRLLSHQPRI